MSSTGTAVKFENRRLGSAEDLDALRDQIVAARDPNRPEIIVCHGTGCMANGSPALTDAIKTALKNAGIQAGVIPGIKTTGCQGFCSRGPLVVVRPQGFFYQRVKPKDAQEIIELLM